MNQGAGGPVPSNAVDPVPNGRGQLRIYLGAAPGVGKTYAMLGEAQRRYDRGGDVVVGLVETHGRKQTQAMLAGLEVIPRRQLEHRGTTFEEMDVDAILDRKPRLVLVDELAHTNISGSRNAKRWQDINELLAAGIDVISTVNIQHLESLNDVVEAITGIKQRETVPDAVVRAAGQIQLVDMSPEALRRRLAHGNIYAAEKVDAALGNYFRAGNLTALRELALLWLADRVEEGLERYRLQHGINTTWATRTRIVVAVAGNGRDDALLRRGALIAGRTAGRDLIAVHVVRGDGTLGASADALARHRALVEDLGGTFHTVIGEDTARGVLDFARSVNGTQIVVGTSGRGRISTALQPSTADLIVRDSGDIDVHVVTLQAAKSTERPRRTTPHQRRLQSWAVSLTLPVLVTFALLPLRSRLSIGSVLLTYLLSIVASSLIGGLIPAVIMALEAGTLANFFYVPPYGSWTISDPQNAFALAVFVLVGSVIASIVDRSTARAEQAARVGAEASILASLSVGVLGRQDGVRALLDQARETFGMRSAALFEQLDGSTRPIAIDASGIQPPTTPEAADVQVNAGPGLTLALSGKPLPTTELRVLDAFAAQTAAVLERNRLSAKVADAARLRESESVRTALLAAVSHDLRTPLAGIKASINTLRDKELNVAETDRHALLADVADSADRLDALVANLLDLTRIQSGAVHARLEPTSLDEVLQHALNSVEATAVRDETTDSLPLIRTDAGLLERAIANLIENAIRYTPEDEPVRLSAAAVPGNALQLRVIDRGPGVPEEDRERMFHAFQRLGDVPEGTGVGLGLAVARGLLEAIGASVEAEDTPGGGLTMVITIPLAESITPQEHAQP